MQSYAKEIEFFTIQISEVCLQLKILSTLLLCDNILDLLPQLIAHSFFFFLEFSLQKIARRDGFCLPSAGRTIFHLSPKYLMGRIVLQLLEVHTLCP